MKRGLVILAVIFLIGMNIPAFAAEAAKSAAPAAAPTAKDDNTIIESGWTKRCEPAADKKGKEYCEIFQRMTTKKDSLRIAEFGLGYNDGKTDAIHGAIVLPLGVLLQPGVLMKVDDGKPVSFKVAYCIKGGCFSYITLESTFVDSMKKGHTISFQFKAADGKNVNLIMKLDNFEKVLKEIQP